MVDSGIEIKQAIEQISVIKNLLRTETNNCPTSVLKASRELGDFRKDGDGYRAFHLSDLKKTHFETEAPALDWIVCSG